MEQDNPQATSSDSNEIFCHFYDPSSGAGKNPNRTCQGKATGFIRKTHDKRLCPLCPSCKDNFVKARQEMSEEVKKSIPGAGEFSDVEITPETVEEYKAQTKKQVPAGP